MIEGLFGFLPHFGQPLLLLLLLLLPVLWYWQRQTERKRKASLRFPSLSIVKKTPPTWGIRVRKGFVYVRLGLLGLFFIALARPQKGESTQETTTDGVDIVLTLDISSSMKTMDFKPKNRLVAAKQVIEDFVQERKTDRIGLVIFAGKSFTQCPLTLDYNILVQFLKQVDFGMVEDGTAIGTALINSANRLRDSEAKSKVVILLTDGENTAGEVNPVTASKALKALGIKVYTIGVGKNGLNPIEIEDPLFGKRIAQVETRIDEKTLQEIAQTTGGRYYRAQNPKALKEIYKEIDTLEKTEINTNTYTRYSELFIGILLCALVLLLIEIVLINTRFMKIP
jgi:Ca-activated chloride channel family protein